MKNNVLTWTGITLSVISATAIVIIACIKENYTWAYVILSVLVAFGIALTIISLIKEKKEQRREYLNLLMNVYSSQPYADRKPCELKIGKQTYKISIEKGKKQSTCGKIVITVE